VWSYALAHGALFVLRLGYFGYPFPNTLYAKVSPQLGYNLREGVRYAVQFFEDAPGALGCLLFAAGAMLFSWVRRERDILGLCVCVLVFFAPPLLTGGDHFPQARFFQPLWPILALPLTVTLPRLANGQSARARWVVHAFAVFLSLLAPLGVRWSWWREWGHARGPLEIEFGIAREQRETGERLRGMFAPEFPGVGAVAAGGLKVAYPGFVFDVIGLNDTEVAHGASTRVGVKNHAAFSAETFWRRPPEIFVPTTYPTAYAWTNFALAGFLSEPRFQRDYVFAQLLGGPSMKPVFAWVRRDRIDALRKRVSLFVMVSHDAAVP
jgi:hypothetical protein